ncbi:MAG: glycosyltransferase [Candidatus Melainabacteria bacterium]|nr:MAG: glycosyltransferase [Candidatus Melainabacteria bacterium]
MSAAPISVVVASQNARASIAECLSVVVDQARELNAEVLVADASTDGTDTIVREQFPQVTLLKGDATKDLIPQLWGLGMRNAGAPIVAITNAQCIPEPNWLASMQKVFDTTDVTGVGGPINPPINGSALDWAIYFSRFTAFMPPVQSGFIRELPGDNVAYTKSGLDAYWKDRENGFWETLFHHQLREHQQSLYMSPDVKVHLAHTVSGDDFWTVRMRHGRHYGSTRPNTSVPARFVRILSAPILVPYLVGRMGMRVLTKRKDFFLPYLRALPWLVIFTIAWSIGEVQGYLSPVHEQS